MAKITVKGKTYEIGKVTPRALYEMQPAMEMFNKINLITQASLKGETTQSHPNEIKEAMDVMIDWFIVYCGNKFTREDLLDGYEADTIIIDIGVALRAAQLGMTEAIKAFPTTARPSQKETTIQGYWASRWASIQTVWKKALRRRS